MNTFLLVEEVTILGTVLSLGDGGLMPCFGFFVSSYQPRLIASRRNETVRLGRSLAFHVSGEAVEDGLLGFSFCK